MFEDVDLNAIHEENARELIKRLLNLVEQLSADLRDAPLRAHRWRSLRIMQRNERHLCLRHSVGRSGGSGQPEVVHVLAVLLIRAVDCRPDGLQSALCSCVCTCFF